MKSKYVISICILLSIGLSSCAREPNANSFKVKTINSPVSMQTEAQKAYMNDQYKNILMHAGNRGEMSLPNPLNLSFKIKKNKNIDANQYTLSVWKDGDNNNIIYNLNNSNYSYSLYNLERGVSYHYQFSGKYKSQDSSNLIDFSSEVYSFETLEEYPRTLNIEGTTNVRDLGGIGNIKQGRIFRSAELNDGSSESYVSKITENGGCFALSNELGIKSEIDVRRDSETGKQTECAFGRDKNYYHFPMAYQGAAAVMTYKDDEVDNVNSVNSFFTTLANSDNLPAIYHCTFGKDRTGYLSYLLGAICNATDEQLYRDYLFSDFADISSTVTLKNIDGIMEYPAYISRLPGNSLKDKTIYFLTSGDEGCMDIDLDIVNNVISNLCD